MAAIATQIINGRLGISAQWMVIQGIATLDSLRQREHRAKIIPLTRGGRGVLKVYEYRTLPEELKRKVDEQLNVYEAAKKNLLEPRIEHSAEVRQYFDDYRTAKGAHLPNSQSNPVRNTYYYNAIVIKAIVRMVKEMEKKGDKVSWEQIAEYVCTLDKLDWPISLPENHRKLHRKVLEFEREGLECLVHKNYKTGSQNAVKVHEGEQADMLISLISEHRNFDCQEIANLYNHWAEQHGWELISRSTVQKWAQDNKFITMASKHGAAAFRNQVSYTVKRKAPTSAMYLWVFDGWDAELAYQKRGKNGRTTYHNRLTLEVILDAATKYPIGWAVGECESADLIREALRNAERHVEELTGQMLRPHQLQCDNFAKKAMWDTYTELALLAVTPARVGNAKSKIIEPWFHHLNDKHCRYAFNWTGHGVTANKENQPNLDITLSRKSNIPTLEELIEEISLVMGQYRAEALPAYQKALEALSADERVALDMKQYLSLFGQSTGQTYQLQATGINVRIMGQRHQYDLLPATDSEKDIQEAIRFREKCWEKWNVKLDPLDKNYILVENSDQTEQFLLTLKDEQPMALKDRKPGDYEKLAAVWKFNREMEAYVAKAICDHQQGALEQVQRERRDYEVLSKALITDNRGQHKSVKAGARLAIEPAEPVDAFEAAPKTEDDVLDEY